MENCKSLSNVPVDIINLIDFYRKSTVWHNDTDVMIYLNQIYHEPHTNPCEFLPRPKAGVFPEGMDVGVYCIEKLKDDEAKDTSTTFPRSPFNFRIDRRFEKQRTRTYEEYCKFAQVYANEFGYAVWVGYSETWQELINAGFNRFITLRPDWTNHPNLYYKKKIINVGDRNPLHYGQAVSRRECKHEVPLVAENVYGSYRYQNLDSETMKNLHDLRTKIGGYVVPAHGWQHWRSQPSPNQCFCLWTNNES